MTITVDPTYTGVASASGQGIRISADYFRTHPDEAGALIHEAVHVMQHYGSGSFNTAMPSWMVEGIADYGRNFIYGDHAVTLPSSSQYYTDAYQPAAYFLNWLQGRYDQEYVHKLNVAGNQGTIDYQSFQYSDGKNIDEAWAQMVNQTPHTGAYTSVSANKCIDVKDGSLVDGSRVRLWPCNGATPQKITARQNSDGTVTLLTLGKCLEVANGETANGTEVWLNGCSFGVAQKWQIHSDKTIVNPNSGKCLEIANGGTSSADDAQIQIFDCGSGNWQKWNVPAGTPTQ
jgi:hypothetical protein